MAETEAGAGGGGASANEFCEAAGPRSARQEYDMTWHGATDPLSIHQLSEMYLLYDDDLFLLLYRSTSVVCIFFLISGSAI